MDTNGLMLLCICYAFLWISLFNHTPSPLPLGIDVGNSVIDVIPSPINISFEEYSNDVVVSCGRVSVSGISRLKLQHYASVYNVTVNPSITIPKKWHNKIQVCFHKNSSLGLCECEEDDWRSLQNGLWSSTMSTYEHKYVDVKFADDVVTGSVTVKLDEVQQAWRYILLVLGVVLMFLAPVVSKWLPFYYASSIGIATLAVVLIILYQARKLLPTGRKNTFYLCILSTVIGVRCFLVQNLSEFVNSVLLNYGISPEVQFSVYYFVVLGIFLFGAAIGYWLLRRYVISEDGEVYDGVAQFVKWSMQFVAVTCIFLSPKDTPLAVVATGSCLTLSHLIAKIKWRYHRGPSYFRRRKNLCAVNKQTTPKYQRAVFLSESSKTRPLGRTWSSPINSLRWFNSPVKSMVSPLTNTRSTGSQRDFYSTYHKIPNRKTFSMKEWEEFTEESTRQSIAELVSTPEFTNWVIKNASKIKFDHEDSLDDLSGSGTDSTDEYEQQSGNKLGFFDW